MGRAGAWPSCSVRVRYPPVSPRTQGTIRKGARGEGSGRCRSRRGHDDERRRLAARSDGDGYRTSAALDVHQAQATACVRTRAPRDRREQHLAEFATTVQGLLGLRDGLKAHGVTHVAMEDLRRLLEAAVGDPRGRVRALARQRAPRQAGPGPQDRRLRRRVACPAARGGARELRAAQADPHAAQPDALSQGADPGAPARGQPPAQGARGHRRRARLRRLGHPRCLGPGNARRARVRHDQCRGAGGARQGTPIRQAARPARGPPRVASTTSTRSSSGRSWPTSTSSTRPSTGSPT